MTLNQILAMKILAGGPGSGPHKIQVTSHQAEWTDTKGIKDLAVTTWNKSHTAGIPSNEKKKIEIQQNVKPPKGFDKSNLVGYVLVRNGRNFPADTYSHPDFRRQGVATKMYDAYTKATGAKLGRGMLTPEGKAFRDKYDAG